MHEVLVELLRNKQSRFEETVAKQKSYLRNDFKGPSKAWLGDTNRCVSYRAINLVNSQWLMVMASKRDMHRQLKPCTGAFRKQLGLPCAHEIDEFLEHNDTLTRDHFDRFWWLDRPLDEEEPLFRIQDPLVVQNTRGRPQGVGPFGEAPPSTAPAALGAAPPVNRGGRGSRSGGRGSRGGRRGGTNASAGGDGPNDSSNNNSASNSARGRGPGRPRGSRSSRGRGDSGSGRDPQPTQESVRRTPSQWEQEDVGEIEGPPAKRLRSSG